MCAVAVHGQLTEVVMGRADDWSDLSALHGTRLVPGRWGDLDLVLDDALDAAASTRTDLWVSFDRSGRPAGRYRPYESATQSGEPTVTDANFVRGGSSGVFDGDQGFSLLPEPGAFLSPGTLSRDFTIQFWLYPAVLQEGEELLSWAGSLLPEGGPLRDRASGASQRLAVTIQDRRVNWHFDGLFRAAGSPVPAVQELTGLSPLVPRRWHHHFLRFDSNDGTLEYLLDGIPHAITHVTNTRREGGTVGSPWVGTGRQAPLRIGDTFVGLMDDLQLTTTLIEPELTRYRGRVGWAATRVFDLGHADSTLVAVEVKSETLGSNAEIFYYYRIAQLPFAPSLPASGAPDGPVAVQFDPDQPFLNAPHGRYLQLLFELLPSGSTIANIGGGGGLPSFRDGRRLDKTPHLQEVRIRYLPVAPPPPPSRVAATPGDNAVLLRWQPATAVLGGGGEIGGYVVFYGTRPGQYLAPALRPPGTVADQGASPIDVGAANELLLTGLSNGTVYYLAIAAYDGLQPPQLSPFSAEVAARPSAVRRLQVRVPSADDASVAGVGWPTLQ